MSLVPKIPRIIFDVVFLQKGEELILIRTFSVVFRLPLDVGDGVVNLCDSDAECIVSFSPREVTVLRKCIMYPLRRPAVNKICWSDFDMLTFEGSDKRT